MKLARESDRVRVSELVSWQKWEGSEPFELEKECDGRSGQIQLRKMSLHTDVVLCILRGDALEASGLGGSRTAHFTAHGQRPMSYKKGK